MSTDQKINASGSYIVKGSTLIDLLKFANEWKNLEVITGTGKIPTLVRGEVKSTLSIPESSGGSLPTGYGPEEWTVYDGGVVTTRNFLTDNPD